VSRRLPRRLRLWRGHLSPLFRRPLPAALSLAQLGVRMVAERPGPLRDLIVAEVGSWPGVTAHRHRFGGVELRVGRRELGHIHGNHLVDLPFPVRIRQQLVAASKAYPHHIIPDSGWVSYPLRNTSDVPGAIALFRIAWKRSPAALRDDETRNPT
jgi:hypothetical protein